MSTFSFSHPCAIYPVFYAFNTCKFNQLLIKNFFKHMNTEREQTFSLKLIHCGGHSKQSRENLKCIGECALVICKY